MMAGSLAPDFSLVDQNGETRALSSYRGRWVVLYFYPKDDTPGCTTEACQFRDDYAAVQRLGADILGVSIDNRASHAAFSKKFSLPFPLLADTDGRVAKQYGALWGRMAAQVRAPAYVYRQPAGEHRQGLPRG